MVAGCSVNSGAGSSRTGPNGSGLGWRAGRGSIAAIASAEQAVSRATHAARRAPAGTELWPGRTFPEWSIVEASMHGGHGDPAAPQDGRAGHGARYEDSANRETDGPPGEREVPSRPDEPPPRHRLAGGDVTGQVAGMCEIPGVGTRQRMSSHWGRAPGDDLEADRGGRDQAWGDLTRKYHSSALWSGRCVRAWGCAFSPAINGRVASFYISR